MARSTRVFVGHSDDCDEEDAIDEVVEAMASALDGPPNIAIANMSATYDMELMAKHLQKVWPEAALIGVTGSGISSSGRECLDDSIAVLGVRCDTVRGEVGFSDGFSENSAKATSRALEQALKKGPSELPTAVYLYPSGQQGNLNQMVSAVDEQFGEKVPIFGALAGDTLATSTGFCCSDGQQSSDGIALLCIWGDLNLKWGVRFGQQTVGEPMTVTEVHGTKIIRLDGKLAYDKLTEYYPGFRSSEGVAWGFSLGVLKDNGEVGYVRSVYPGQPGEQRDHILLGTDIPLGAQVKLQVGEVSGFMSGAEQAVDEAICAWDNPESPAGYIITSCAARRWTMGSEFTKEIELISEKISDKFGDIPSIGSYAFGEIAPVGTHNRFHNEACIVTLVG